MFRYACSLAGVEASIGPRRASSLQPADPLALFAVDSSCAYPSMRADYDATEAEYDAESRARMSTAPPMNNERVKRPTAVFISNLPANLTDQQLTEKFDCGVIREVFRIRDKSTREFNGCAVVTFGSVDATERALKMNGTEIGGKTISIRRSEKRLNPVGRKPRNHDDEGGARFDSLNNRLFPHEVPEAQKDFKKRRLAYPRDHVRE